jgi:hypothetical protein
MTDRRITRALIVAAISAVAACIIVPRGLDAEATFVTQNDHVPISEGAVWMLAAVLAALTFAVALKVAAERIALRGARRRRKARMIREIERRLAAEAARG